MSQKNCRDRTKRNSVNSNNKQKQEGKMSNEDEWGLGGDVKQEKWERYFIMNEEFNKVICIGAWCRRAIDKDDIEGHLKRRHKVKGLLRKRIARAIGEKVERGWGMSKEGIPVDGLGPQKGLRVFGGFQCKGCSSFKGLSKEEVEEHWVKEGHEEIDGERTGEVQIQSWEGEIGERWVVDERKHSGREEMVVGEITAGMWIEEGTTEERMEETAEDDEEKVVREVVREVVVGVAEGSEGWVEEDDEEWKGGQVGQERLEEWEESCVGWNWKEVDEGGWDQTCGDWVVVR